MFVNRSLLKAVSALSAVAVLWVAGTGSAGLALTTIPDTTTAGIGASCFVDGSSYLGSLYCRARTLAQYEYTSELVAYTNGKATSESGRFYFKAPHLVRFEVTHAGIKSGSVVVWQPDGGVRARGGLALGYIRVDLNRNSPWLKAANGCNVLSSDVLSIVVSITNLAKQGDRILVSRHAVKVSDSDRPVCILDVTSPDGKQLVQQIYFDPAMGLPLLWRQFSNGRLQSECRILEFRTAVNLADSLFYI